MSIDVPMSSGPRAGPRTSPMPALAVDTLRFLAADMVQQANSGHPGMPMGAAPMAWTLWSRHLKHDPADPHWTDRDRFVLCAGHGSALLYGLLHLFGYDLPMERAGEIPPARLRDAGAPRVRAHRRGRDHDRTARSGAGDGRRARPRRAHAGRPVPGDHRPPHLRHRRRRLPDGGHQPRGALARRAPRARSARRALGRQRHHHRRQRRPVVAATTSWPGSPPTAGTSCRSRTAPTSPRSTLRITQAKADPRPSLIAVRTVIGHGAPGIEGTPAGTRLTARGSRSLAAAKAAAGWEHPPFTVPEEVADPVRPARRRRAPRPARVVGGVRVVRHRRPGAGRGVEARDRQRGLPADLDEVARRRSAAATTGPPASRRRPSSGPWPPSCPSWSAARPTSPGRPAPRPANPP